MTRYAANTEVSAEKSKMEIETTCRRYGADGFISGWDGPRAFVQFRINGRYVRFLMTLPAQDDPALTTYMQGKTRYRRTEAQCLKNWEQACRQKWRALALMIKAKLEGVESGIVEFEQEFLGHIMIGDDGRTVYDHARGQVKIAYETGAAPAMLPDYSGRAA